MTVTFLVAVAVLFCAVLLVVVLFSSMDVSWVLGHAIDYRAFIVMMRQYLNNWDRP